MKIKKSPVKKLAVPPLPIRNLIKTLKESPESDIATHIEAVPEWVWPRGDLFHWVTVLNRFDDILDNVCKTHEMKKAQPKEFSDENKRLTLAILGFSRMLLENCTNRNLYASYEQLNDLLHTRDLDVLESCLRLLLRPAQRHSAQRSGKSIFTVSQDRLLALAHPWGTKEHGQDLLQLADEDVHIPEKLSGLNFQFYRTAKSNIDATATTTGPTTSEAQSTSPTGTSTKSPTTATLVGSSSNTSPTKQRRFSHSGSSSTSTTPGAAITAAASEGLVTIHASNIRRFGASDYEILAHFVKEYDVPEEHRFSLLNRIRVATGVNIPQRRHQLLTIRILGIAVISHVLPEGDILDKLLAFEPDIIQSLTELIHPDHKAPIALQTVALFALDGLAHLRSKQGDVLTAVNASASHGVLLYLLRKIINGMDSDNAYPQDFIDAIFAFVTYIIGSQSGGSMVVSAGIVPVLLKLLSNRHFSQVKNVTKSVSILDSLIYGFSTAFTSFCSSNGLETLVTRIKDEVDSLLALVKGTDAPQMATLSNKDDTFPVPFERTALLKAMFKFVLHMMQNPGSQEGLRNLIDTTLPSTLRDIMERPDIVGPAVFAHAINTMGTFIHNEPTSLSILQEAKIPQTLLATLSKDIPASTDVVLSIPGAFGAICLNAPGLEMFNKDFKLKSFFDLFTSESHVRAFQDSELASNLGMSVDELVRHQPSLRTSVMSEINTMLEGVLERCSVQNISAEDMDHCSLQKSRPSDAPPPGEAASEDSSKEDKKESLVPLLIEGAARFCESFFQNTSSAKDFLKAGGIDTLMKFYSLQTLPYDLASTPAFLSLSYLIKMLSETNPTCAVTAVLKEASRLLEVVQPLLESTNPGSDLMKYIDIRDSSDAEVEQGNKTLRSLISLYGLSGLISDMFCAPAFSHGRNSASVLQAFVAAQGDKALAGLGQLHRMCVWESIAMKRVLQKSWSDPSSKPKKPLNAMATPGTVDFNVEELGRDEKDTSASSPAMDPFNPATINTKYFNFVLTQTPHCISPLYQGLTKLLFNRRDTENTQRANSFKIAYALSNVLQAHISWGRYTSTDIVADKYTYLTTMLQLLPFLMLDDRNPPTLQTIVVASFVKTGGLQILFSTLDSVWDEVRLDRSADDKARMYGVIEVILNVLHTVTSSKLLHDSSHTSTLSSKDEKVKGKDYFQPYEFLVDARLSVLPKVKALWMDPLLCSCPISLVRQLVQILINILKAEGELKPERPPGPSIILGGTPSLFGARPLVADEASITILLDMGFPRAAAEIALMRSNNQIDRATEYLLSHQDIVAAAIYDQEQAATRAATSATTSIGTSTDDAPGGEGSGSNAAGTSNGPETSSQEGSDDEGEDEMLQHALDMSVVGSSTTTSSEGSSAANTGKTINKTIEKEGDADTHKAHKEELSKLREETKLALLRRSFELIPTVNGVIFTVRDVVLFLYKDKDSTVLDEVVDATLSAGGNFNGLDQESSRNTKEDSFGAFLRLLALLFSEASIQPKLQDYALKLLPLLMSTLGKAGLSGIPQKENTWLSPLLLMIEGFISITDEPKVAPDATSAEGRAKAAQQDTKMTAAPVSTSDMEILLNHCATLLKQEELSKDVVLSVFRILVRLTRHHSLAVKFLEADGLPLMFATMKQDKIGVQGQQSFIIMVMRHIIEDTSVLQATVEREISKWFSHPSRARSAEIQAYLRQNNYLGLRDLDAFIAGTLKACKITKYDSSYRAITLALAKFASPPKAEAKNEGNVAEDDKEEKGKESKESKESKADKDTANDSNTEEMATDQKPTITISTTITEATKKYSSEISEAVVSYLVTELLNTRSTTTSPSDQTSIANENKELASKSETNESSALKDGADKTLPSAAEVLPDPDFVHRCFLLQCLNELIASYPTCKLDLVNYSRRKNSKDPLHSTTKPRGNWISYLLHELIPGRPTICNLSDVEKRKRSIESNFATGVLVALCSNSDEEEEKKPNGDLAHVRRFVVDGITRAFKDAISSGEPIEIKYGRFISLSKLSYKILNSSHAVGVLPRTNDDMSINIVKVMLEKHFIMTLTNVVADIDLNYPSASESVNAVLKPLEYLTKLSLKMSRTSESSVPKPKRLSTPLSGQGSGAGSGDDAPDLYRNSSLGMFDGATNIESDEDGHHGDSMSEEEMYEGAEFDEETASDASDLSEDVSGDDDEDDGEDMQGPFESSDEDDNDHEDDDDDPMDDEDEDGEDIDAELQETLDRDEEDGEDMVMEWNGDDHQPVILGEDDIAEVIDDDGDAQDNGHDDHDDDDDENEQDEQDEQEHGHFVGDRDRRQHHHHHHSGDEGTEDDEDDGEDEDEDVSDEDDEDMDDDDDDEDHDDLEDGGEPQRRNNRHNPWNMTSTFVLNENALRGGRPLFESIGRRGHRLPGQERGLIWDDIGAEPTRLTYFHDGDHAGLLRPPFRDPLVPTTDDVITHPLLAPPPSTSAAGSGDGRIRLGTRTIGLNDWHDVEELLQGSAEQVLGTLLNSGTFRASHGGAFRLEVNNNNSTTLIPLNRLGGHHHHHHHHGHHHMGDPLTTTISIAHGSTDATTGPKPDAIKVVHDFVSLSTSRRWSQECRMMYGTTLLEKAQLVNNHLLQALIPVAKEEERLKLEREAKEMEIRRKADAERKKMVEEMRKAEEEAQRAKELKEQEARLAEEQAANERATALTTETAVASDAGGEAGRSGSSMELEGSSTPSTSTAPTTSSEPAAPARRMIMIDGEEVDITDSDMDVEFLEALPEDMRREVYNDYLQAHRPAPSSASTTSNIRNSDRGTGGSSSTSGSTSTSATNNNINPDFLNALPPEMRDELNELMRGPHTPTPLPPRGPAQTLTAPMAPRRTNAQIEASLTQSLQNLDNMTSRAIQAMQGLDDMAMTLFNRTQAMLDANLNAMHDRLSALIAGSDNGLPSSRKPAVQREAMQLVDKSSLATLIRLMFLPQPPSENVLNKLLTNLCENGKTRADLLSLLLSVLQDGGADLAAVDRSFAHMSLRGKPLLKAPHQPKGAKGSTPSATQALVDIVPNLVARRCLESLHHIVSQNEQASLFFLSEHENMALKRPTKKGKGKEKAVSSRYPIVLLLDLLERPVFVQNLSLMEQLMALLSIICRPLANLIKPADEKSEENKEKGKEKDDETEKTEGAVVAESGVEAEAPSTTVGDTTATGGSTTAGEGSAAAGPSSAENKAETKPAEPTFQPPIIPDHYLQLVVHVLTAGECSSRTFQYTLSLIQNLSALTGAKDIITSELTSAARDLGTGILEDLGDLSQTLENAMSGVDVQGLALDKFSPASSKQAKLLRVLKTIDYMYSRKPTPSTPAAREFNIELAPTVDPEEADSVLPRSMRDIHSDGQNLNKDEEKVTEIYDSLSFQSLWTKVGDTLELIRERNDMVHVATVLLPLIESLMVVCKYVGLRPSTLEVDEKGVKHDSIEDLFLQFTDKHSKILNIMVRNNPALMSGSFSLLVHNPKMLEFDNKRNYFTQQLHKRGTRDHHRTLQMNIRRDMVFMDSFSHWQARTGDDIKYSKLNVRFHGEEGVDGGGVTREWFQVLARQMFNPDYAMFKTSAADKLTYQPNRASGVNPDHLMFFKFIGRVIGKAIYDGRLLDAYFTRSFYKHILGRPVDYRDVEAVDPEYYKSLVWMLENDITDIVEETFSVETDDFGIKKTVDLKPNGRNILVTDENKHEYVKFITEQKLTLAIKDQIHSFLQGFHDIIPAHLISIFNEQELELLISGLPDIDIDEWKNNSEYQTYTPASPQIQNFWRAVRSFDQTERAKLLQFVTGTSKVPLGGFSQLQGISGIQKFQIHKDFSSTKRLPSAHTCFNQLDLPEYESYEELRQQLLLAISECSTGFAFA
ncbi:hypothetical protein B0O80DRAFT_501281 [Mortierella sp. GBAus27b]|nr:hypothetical protein B0O80DRAFT_501281 [Mortierella sp. GBAus27b]